MGRGESGLDLEHRPAARGECPLGGDAAAGDEHGSHIAGLQRGDEDATLELAEPPEPVELGANCLQSGHSVAEPGRILETARIREREEAALEAGQRVGRTSEIVRRERPRRKLRLPPRPQRPL